MRRFRHEALEAVVIEARYFLAPPEVPEFNHHRQSAALIEHTYFDGAGTSHRNDADLESAAQIDVERGCSVRRCGDRIGDRALQAIDPLRHKPFHT